MPSGSAMILPEVALARFQLGTLSREAWLQQCQRVGSWEALLARMQAEGLTEPLLESLAQERVPFLRQVKKLTQGKSRHQARKAETLSQLADIVQACQLQALLLRDVPAQIDCPLLIEAWALPRIDSKMRSQGFSGMSPSVYQKEGVTVELRLDVLNSPNWPAFDGNYRFSVDSWLSRGQALAGVDQALQRPSPEDEFVRLSVLTLRRGFKHLGSLLELGVLLRQASLCGILELAEESRALKPVAYSLHLIERLFQIPLPLMRGRIALNPLEAWSLETVFQRHAWRFGGELLACLSVPGLLGKALHLGERLSSQSRGVGTAQWGWIGNLT